MLRAIRYGNRCCRNTFPKNSLGPNKLVVYLSMQQEEYLSEFAEVLLFIVGGALFIIVSLLISRLARPNRPNVEKRAPYESGEEPVGASWGQFNARFYVIALIFILFEVRTCAVISLGNDFQQD